MEIGEVEEVEDEDEDEDEDRANIWVLSALGFECDDEVEHDEINEEEMGVLVGIFLLLGA